jgi:two-component system chemotaxis sensor kinase CheA
VAAESGRRSLLVVNAGDDSRCAVPLGLVARIETFPASAIERVAGREMVQYRGGLMPLIRPEEGAPLGAGRYDADDQPVVVLDLGHPIGLRVNAIVDAAEAEMETDRADLRPGLLGHAVLLGKATLLLDVHDLARRLAPPVALERAAGGAR